jgi:hypothetical protein
MAEELARTKADKEELDILLKVRALLATAESSPYEGEAESFRAKAMAMAERYEIEPALLAYPCEHLKVAVTMAEIVRLKEIVQAYEDEDETWETKTAEWSYLLDEYDGVLEVACDILCLPLNRLPYGCRRHFRPDNRAKIEKLIWDRVLSGRHDTDSEAASPAAFPFPAGSLFGRSPETPSVEAQPVAAPESRLEP